MAVARVTPIPNFFIVGAPKCATTAMDRYLGEHPEIYMSPAKESNFFARDLYPNGGGCTQEHYDSFFAGVKDESIVGESSVFYLLSETAAKAIHDFQPKAKILIMLRDPIELIASHHSQIVFETFETEKNLERALALEAERRKRSAGRQLPVRERVLRYREVVQFTRQISRFLEYFPKEQVHIVLYDDVKRDLAGVYKGILTFLGVDPNFIASFEVENANKKMRSEKFAKFLRYTPDWVSAIGRIILPKREWRVKLRYKLKSMNTQFTAREEMSPALHAALAKELKPEVERLSALLNRDLSHWCVASSD